MLLSLARLLQEHARKPPKKWLKSQEVMTLSHISHGTLYSMRCSGTLPFKKIGNIIYNARTLSRRLKGDFAAHATKTA